MILGEDLPRYSSHNADSTNTRGIQVIRFGFEPLGIMQGPSLVAIGFCKIGSDTWGSDMLVYDWEANKAVVLHGEAVSFTEEELAAMHRVTADAML